MVYVAKTHPRIFCCDSGFWKLRLYHGSKSWLCITAPYYGSVLRLRLTAPFYGSVFRACIMGLCITALYCGFVLRARMTARLPDRGFSTVRFLPFARSVKSHIWSINDFSHLSHIWSMRVNFTKVIPAAFTCTIVAGVSFKKAIMLSIFLWHKL